MKQFFKFASVVLISGALVTVVYAQQTDSTKSPQNQYTGVSHPPPNSTIVANEPDTPTPTTTAKPSAATPAQPAPAAHSTPPTAYYGSTATATPDPAANTDPNRYNNTDFGIVTKLPDQRATRQVEAMNARLAHRTSDPSYGVVSSIPSIPNALNSGTNITVRLLQPLSTSTTPQGTPFRATVVSNVYRGSQLVIPSGSELRGIVTGVHTGRRLVSRATLRLTPQLVLLPDGKAYHMDAEAIYTSAHHAKTTDEGSFQPRMHLAKDSAEYGAGAGIGALVGSRFGPGGALIGTLVGAGAVSAHMLMKSPSALTLPRNTEVIFSLTQPMQLTPASD